MGENREFRLDEISLRSIFKEPAEKSMGHSGGSGGGLLSVTGVEKLTYVPQYTATATLAVNTTSSRSAYTSLSLTSQMAGVFGEIFGSSVLETGSVKILEWTILTVRSQLRSLRRQT